MQPEINEIHPGDARAALDAGSALFVDIRDPASHREARIPGCRHLTAPALQSFLAEVDRSRPLVVYCYHGNASLGAAAWLVEQGFQDVRSLAGGFELWRELHPDLVAPGDETP